MQNLREVLLAPALLLSIAAAAQAPAPPAQQKAPQPGIAVQNMDRSVIPGDNFYQYANGDWIKRAVIPPDRASVGVFLKLFNESNKHTADLIQEAARANAPEHTDRRRIADLYNSYMNTAAIQAKGMTPIEPQLKKIAAIRNKEELARALGESLRADVDPLNNTNFHTENIFGLWVAPGFRDSAHYAPYLLEGGLVLPTRAYYLSDNAHMQKIRSEYRDHVIAMLRLANISEPEMRADRILALERAIAEKHLSLAENEDVHKANNLWTTQDFAAKAPGLDWATFFKAAGLANQKQFYVWQPSAFTGESALVASTPLDTWKDWLTYHMLEQYAGALPKAVADEEFHFFGQTLYGVPQQSPRWERGVGLVNVYLGDAVGQIYAQKYFSPQAKAEAQAMVANIIAAFRQRIERLQWMNPATKAEAEAKLSTLYVGVGYPETWKSYSGYVIKPDSLFGNVWRGKLFRYQQQVGRLGSNVDRHEWSMEPQTVNAVNLPLQNALNFPAAILQPPFFDPKAPAAANYGAIGSVIGHEISHTFDTEGSTFDSKGALRDWWTPQDLAHFNAATAKLAAQYDTYRPFPDLAVNGKQTLAEDIADVAGISAAYDGYHASLKGAAAPEFHGFSGDQQFFIAFAQNWASKERPAALRQQVLTDPHAPAQYRADTVRNIDAWYTAFDVKPGQTLYLTPENRVRIW